MKNVRPCAQISWKYEHMVYQIYKKLEIPIGESYFLYIQNLFGQDSACKNLFKDCSRKNIGFLLATIEDSLLSHLKVPDEGVASNHFK
jgi:hypothetical protein